MISNTLRPKLPDTTFTGHLSKTVGTKRVDLIEVGPAHTGGDAIVHVPDDRAVFTGDILFIDGHPIVWAGPIGNWIAACEMIEGLDAQTIVPGHGPVTDKQGVARVRDYLVYIRDEAKKRHDAGMGALEAARVPLHSMISQAGAMPSASPSTWQRSIVNSEIRTRRPMRACCSDGWRNCGRTVNDCDRV